MFGRLLMIGLAGMMMLPVVAAAQEEHQPAEGQMPTGAPEEMKQFASMDGVYDVHFKFKMDPAAEGWVESDGLVTLTMVLDGCAQKMDWQGEMMGMKFSGLGFLSYNRDKKKYESTWIDNTSGQLSVTEGNMSDGKMVMTGQNMVHGVMMHVRDTTFNMTEKGFESKMEMSPDGENYETVMISTYTKR